MGLTLRAPAKPRCEESSREDLFHSGGGPVARGEYCDGEQQPMMHAQPLFLGPEAHLSPISAVAQRIGAFSLKRAAEEPGSPEPIKRRRLFTDASSLSTPQVLCKGKKVLKTQRRASGERVGVSR